MIYCARAWLQLLPPAALPGQCVKASAESRKEDFERVAVFCMQRRGGRITEMDVARPKERAV